jgi:ABC-2 type transport system ATP-binding protein
MSLTVQHLTKIYDTQKAVNDISFTADKGEIVGFLGPNGAGKSTTMKVATGYLSATSGSVLIDGLDVSEHPLEVKRRTGYLPEHNPLYLDLFVHEYLGFVGGLYGLKGKALRTRVGEMIELCGLGREQNKKIETLSKGYRQRVGLAQALIHNPEVLILDEPTSGLDPNQILEIRKVIRDISINKTVVFSTHIMQEVQALCERVVLINKGEIVADDRLANLMAKQSAANVVHIEFEREVNIDLLKGLPGAMDVVKMEISGTGSCRYRLQARSEVDIRPEVFRLASDHKLSLIGLRQEEASLEAMFRELTLSPPNS